VGYIPKDTEWFVAELVMETTVHGASQNVVDRNLILVRATNAEEAYQRATYWGHWGEHSYENPAGQLVETKFRGISKLDAVIEDIEDGAEIATERIKGVPSDEMDRWIPPKERLEAFVPPPPFGVPYDPDTSSREVMDKLAKELGKSVKPRGFIH
jgi:hypothetical protein